jgi:ribosomal subunit interface protein
MRVTVTARHCDVSDELRALARARVERLRRFASRAHGAQVVFDDLHGVARAEVRLHTTRGLVCVGRGEGTEHRSALDRAVARVRRQLDKAPTGRARAARRRPPARELR